MTTPLPMRRALPSSATRDASPKPIATVNREWRCSGCDKLLGVRRDSRLHIRFARGHEYLVGFPVVATCRSCGTLNQTTVPAR